MAKEVALTGILQKAVEALNCSAGVVALWHDPEGDFVEEAVYGLDSAGIARLRPIIQELIPKLGHEEQHIYRLSDLVPGVQAPEDIQNQESQELMLAFPITLEQETIGLTAVLRSTSAEMFTTGDQRLLSLFADQAALSIQNSHLASQLSEAQCKLTSILENSGDGIHGFNHQREVEDITSTLLATVSHELQTPLSIIKAYTGTLTRPDANWTIDDIKSKLQAIEEESDRLSNLVSKLLYTSRLRTGHLSLNRLLLDIPTEVNRVGRKFSELTEIHEMEADFPPDFPPVLADPEKIEEVLINLLENAVKFSPGGGKITIRGSVSESEVSISISDQGIGVPLRNQDRIFDRFYRGDNSRTGQIQGTGLGLYICKSIIEAHGGQIQVDSSPTEGSRFTFSLPVGEDNS